jgi:hypothetical protein
MEVSRNWKGGGTVHELIIYDNGYESTIQFILRYAKRWEKTVKCGENTYRNCGL